MWTGLALLDAAEASLCLLEYYSSESLARPGKFWGGSLVPAEVTPSCLGMHMLGWGCVFEEQPGLKEVVSPYGGWTEAIAAWP